MLTTVESLNLKLLACDGVKKSQLIRQIQTLKPSPLSSNWKTLVRILKILTTNKIQCPTFPRHLAFQKGPQQESYPKSRRKFNKAICQREKEDYSKTERVR